MGLPFSMLLLFRRMGGFRVVTPSGPTAAKTRSAGDGVETGRDVIVGETGHAEIADEAAMSAIAGDVQFNVRRQAQGAERTDRNDRVLARGQDRGGHVHVHQPVAGDRVAVEVSLERAEIRVPKN